MNLRGLLWISIFCACLIGWSLKTSAQSSDTAEAPYNAAVFRVYLPMIAELHMDTGFNGAAYPTPAPPLQGSEAGTIPPPAECGPTEVTGGEISGAVIWYQVCSPYTLSGNVLVNTGARLTIEAGVEVKFDGFYRIEVAGELIAIGTPSQPIIFTSNRATPQMGDWQAIRFTVTSVYGVVDANDQ